MLCIAVVAILILVIGYLTIGFDSYADVPKTGSITIHKNRTPDTSSSGLSSFANDSPDIYKLPEESEPMPGIDFTLRKIVVDPTPETTADVVFSDHGMSYITDDSGAYAPHTVTTDDAGEAVFRDLPLGYYLISEQGKKTQLPVEIPTIVPGGDGSLLYDIDVYPKILGTDGDEIDLNEFGGVTLLKVDGETDKPLAGASFRLVLKSSENYKTDLNANGYVQSGGKDYIVTTNQKGLASFTKIAYGKDENGAFTGSTDYWLVETEAPEGYDGLKEPETITIDAKSYDAVVYKYKIENAKIPDGIVTKVKKQGFDTTEKVKKMVSSLPLTGDQFRVMGTIIAMAGAAMIIILLLIFNKRRSRKKPDHSSRAGP
jgi:uncharacterized surface anchored protein